MKVIQTAIKQACVLWPVSMFPVILMFAASPATAADETDGTIAIVKRRTATDERLDESSGLAASRLVADRFWTHNDSGDSARLFAIDEAGDTVAVLELQDVSAIDWEDMASGNVFGRNILVVGDVGDNGRRRKSVFLHVLEEPQEPSPKERCRTIEFTYPDGPGDCEAIGLDAENNRVLLIKKTLLPFAGVYAVDLKFPKDKGGAVEAQRIATLPIPMITAMDIRSDGQQMVIATYRDLFVYQRSEGTSWEQTLEQVPKQAVLPQLRQIEAVCYDADGGIWVTSERAPMPLVQIDHERFSRQTKGATGAGRGNEIGNAGNLNSPEGQH